MHTLFSDSDARLQNVAAFHLECVKRSFFASIKHIPDDEHTVKAETNGWMAITILCAHEKASSRYLIVTSLQNIHNTIGGKWSACSAFSHRTASTLSGLSLWATSNTTTPHCFQRNCKTVAMVMFAATNQAMAKNKLQELFISETDLYFTREHEYTWLFFRWPNSVFAGSVHPLIHFERAIFDGKRHLEDFKTLS